MAPSSKNNESLREKAAKKLHGPDANPSQLGDPISLKSETSNNIPKPDEAGAHPSSSSSSSEKKDGSPYTPPLAPPPASGGSDEKRSGETLREKAASKVKGPGANPSQLGDPVSLKNEISQKAPTPTEEGASGGGGGGARGKKGRESKL